MDPECSHNPGPSLPSDLVAVLSLVVHHPFSLQALLLLDWLRLASSPSCLFLSVSNCERVCTGKSSRYTIAFDVFLFPTQPCYFNLRDLSRCGKTIVTMLLELMC